MSHDSVCDIGSDIVAVIRQDCCDVVKEIEDLREETDIIHNTVAGLCREGLDAQDEIMRIRRDLDALQVKVHQGFADLQQIGEDK